MVGRIAAITVSALLVIAYTICAQSRSICLQADHGNPWASNALAPLDINLDFGGDTVDNQGVHPDIEYWPNSFGPDSGSIVIAFNRDGYLDTIIASPQTPRWKYWMVFTPYPNCLASYEDPTLRVSNFKDSGWIRPYAIGDDPTDSLIEDDTVWVSDPIYDHHHFPSYGHNSDPEFIYSPEDGKLYVLFQTSGILRYRNYIKALSSSDGITWDETQAIDFAYSQAADPWSAWNLLSPTATRDSLGMWELWFVDQVDWTEGTQLIRLLYPTLDGNWIAADTCVILPPDTSLQIWHTKIVRSPISNKLFLLATVNYAGSTSSDTLGQYLYVSQNGTSWNLIGEVLNNGTPGAWDNETYRSTFLFEHSAGRWQMPIWYTGSHFDARGYNVWGIGYTEGQIRWHYGDVNGDCNTNALDITFLINMLYKHGILPDGAFQADIDGNCRANILDITYLINFLYKQGPAPAIGCD